MANRTTKRTAPRTTKRTAPRTKAPASQHARRTTAPAPQSAPPAVQPPAPSALDVQKMVRDAVASEIAALDAKRTAERTARSAESPFARQGAKLVQPFTVRVSAPEANAINRAMQGHALFGEPRPLSQNDAMRRLMWAGAEALGLTASETAATT